MSYKTNDNRGQLSSRSDDAPLGGSLDQYGTPSAYPTATLGTVTFDADGDHRIRLVVVGKSAASRGFVLSADRFTLE
jgi:hypothetical protein